MKRFGSGIRVLMTADTVGGVWTYAMELAAAMAAHEVEFIVATMGREPNQEQIEEARSHANVRLAVSSFKLEWMGEPWRDVDTAGAWLLGLAERAGVDLVHLNGYSHGTLPFGVPVVMTGHSCVLSWWEAVRGGEAPAAWDIYRERVRTGLGGADVVVAPTRCMMECLERHYGLSGTRLVIPNGREVVAHAGRGGVARGKEPFVLAAGRVWDEGKNIGVLERIAGELPWPCLVAGEARAPDGAPLSQAPLSKGRRGNGAGVVPLGRLGAGEMAERLARASVFAHPAKYEPFGLAPLEAGLAGCALVLGDIPTGGEVGGHGGQGAEAATFVAPDDAAGWAAALRRLIDDPGLRQRAGANARRRASRYSRRRMGSAYAALYRSLLGRSGEGAQTRETAAID